MLGDAGALPWCKVNTLMPPDHTAYQVLSFGYGRAGIGLSSEEGLNTGRHDKAPEHCPCILLATHHGAPQTLMLL